MKSAVVLIARRGRNPRGTDFGSALFDKDFKMRVGVCGAVFAPSEVLSRRLAEAGGNDLCHAKEGAVFNALGGRDNDLARTQKRAQTGEGGAEELGGNDGDDDLGIADGVFAGGDGDVWRQRKAGKEEGIFAGFSSGANLAAAVQLLGGDLRGGTIVVLMCDSGLKYLSTDLWP